MELSIKQVAAFIDHTLLKPTATIQDIEVLCGEAEVHGFFSVCVNPCYVKVAKNYLSGSDVKVCTVVGFPLGANTTTQKKREAEEAIKNGATEIDMVVALGAIKAGEWGYVKQDIKAVREATTGDALLKVILETGLLTEEEIKRACLVAKEAGADFVKTSTGFLGEGATIEGVSLMRSVVGNELGVKASGGVRTGQRFKAMLEAGANRIGTSSGVTIMAELGSC